MNQQKRAIVEFLVSQKPVQVLLNEAMAIYMEPEEVWISGNSGSYAWSHGSTMGMKGDPYPLRPDDFMAASMHQGAVAACFNMNAGFHIAEIRYVTHNGAERLTVFRLAKTDLLGPSQLVDLAWNGEKFRPYQEEEVVSNDQNH